MTVTTLFLGVGWHVDNGSQDKGSEGFYEIPMSTRSFSEWYIYIYNDIYILYIMSAVEIRNVVHKVSDHFWSHTTVFAGFLALKFGSLVDARVDEAVRVGCRAVAICPVPSFPLHWQSHRWWHGSGGFGRCWPPNELWRQHLTVQSRWNNVWCLGMI
jgi:hypothetical protein